MWRAFLSEWFKIRRRASLIGAVAMVGFSIFGAYFGIVRVTTLGPRAAGVTKLVLQSSVGLPTLLSHGSEIILVIALIIVAASMAAEYSQGTLRNLLVAEPSRLRFLAGKLLALMVYVWIAMTVAMAVGIAVGVAAASARGVLTSNWFTSDGIGNLTTLYGNLVIGAIAWSVLGFFAALLFRSPAAAVGATLAYILVVERLIEAVWTSGTDWLFGSLVGNVEQGGGVFVLTQPTSDYWWSLIGVGIYVAGFLLAGALLFSRRDVTS